MNEILQNVFNFLASVSLVLMASGWRSANKRLNNLEDKTRNANQKGQDGRDRHDS